MTTAPADCEVSAGGESSLIEFAVCSTSPYLKLLAERKEHFIGRVTLGRHGSNEDTIVLTTVFLYSNRLQCSVRASFQRVARH